MKIVNIKNSASPFEETLNRFVFRNFLYEVIKNTGKIMENEWTEPWEGQSTDGSHTWSRNDLKAMAAIIQNASELASKYGIEIELTFENEEVPLGPIAISGDRIRLIIDPIDGSKAFDAAKIMGDCTKPRPSSTICIAAVCPKIHEFIGSAVYCFDTGDAFTSVNIGNGTPEFICFRENQLLRRLPDFNEGKAIEAQKRILIGDYNSQALFKIEKVKLELIRKGLKGNYGGLTGSSACDVINVIRGNYAACMDFRAICQEKGSVPYFYDIAAVIPIAIGRGLAVIITDADGKILQGADHDIYKPVSFLICRWECADTIIEVIGNSFPNFLKSESNIIPMKLAEAA